MALSDKVAVLRKGKYIGTVKTSEKMCIRDSPQ